VRPGRACLPKHDETAVIAVHSWDVFMLSMQGTLYGKGLSPMLIGTTRCGSEAERLVLS